MTTNQQEAVKRAFDRVDAAGGGAVAVPVGAGHAEAKRLRARKTLLDAVHLKLCNRTPSEVLADDRSDQQAWLSQIRDDASASSKPFPQAMVEIAVAAIAAAEAAVLREEV